MMSETHAKASNSTIVLRIIARYAVATNPRDLGLTLRLTKLYLALAKRLSKHMNIFCKVALKWMRCI